MFYSSAAKRIDDDRYLVSYIPEINKENCDKLNLSTAKVSNILNKDQL
jgi:hypothetical protein